MLSCFYIDDANYQENVIPRYNKIDGHDVSIIASTEVYINNIKLGYTNPGKYVNADQITVYRLPYKKVVNFALSKKIRAYSGLYTLIEDFKPDLIFFHGAAAYALVTAVRYVRNHPGVRLLVDSHEDLQNSAKNFISKYVLHKLFYSSILKSCLSSIEKILYITFETKLFLRTIYNVPQEKLLFFPLGGYIYLEGKRLEIRNRIRNELRLRDDNILVLHTGKLDAKKRSHEMINAFCNNNNDLLRLVIIGSIDKNVEKNVFPLINSDHRIKYLGWIEPEQLMEYLCAGDLYIQLGGQSVTMQNALCCGCAAALYPFDSHKFLLNDSVFYIENCADLEKVFKSIIDDRSILENMRLKSFDLAQKKLNYKKISSLIYTSLANMNDQQELFNHDKKIPT